PDNFSLYQPLVAGALWMAARRLRGHARSFALGGLLVGLATLSRNDGLLVGATLGLTFLWDRVRALRSGGERRPAIPVWAAVACFGLFLLIMAPWWWRQLEVFGQLSPSAASGKVLYIRSIDEWNSITTPATLDWLLGQALGSRGCDRLFYLCRYRVRDPRRGRREPRRPCHVASAAERAAGRVGRARSRGSDRRRAAHVDRRRRLRLLHGARRRRQPERP